MSPEVQAYTEMLTEWRNAPRTSPAAEAIAEDVLHAAWWVLTDEQRQEAQKYFAEELP